jgi:hypothetical protein
MIQRWMLPLLAPAKDLAQPAESRQGRSMASRCEVCASIRPDRVPSELSEVSLDGRRILLCAGHAQIAKNSEVTSLEELRDLYRESDGERSYISRRARGYESPGATERASIGRREGDGLG